VQEDGLLVPGELEGATCVIEVGDRAGVTRLLSTIKDELGGTRALVLDWPDGDWYAD
jgi:hypothetical protein